MASVKTLNVTLKARIRGFEKGMQKARRIISKFANKVISVQGAVVGLGAAIGAGVFINYVKGATTALNATTDFADRLGIAVEKLQELQFAASQAGIGQSQLNVGLQRMTRRVAEASKGLGEAKAAIKELGLDAAKLGKLTVDQQFKAIADALSKVKGSSDQVRLAFKLFDSEGVGLINTMRQGSKGLDDMAKKAQKLSIIVTEKEARKVKELGDQFSALGYALQSLGVKTLASMGDEIGKLIKNQANIEAFFKVAVGGFQLLAEVILQFAKAAAAIPGLFGKIRVGVLQFIAENAEALAKQKATSKETRTYLNAFAQSLKLQNAEYIKQVEAQEKALANMGKFTDRLATIFTKANNGITATVDKTTKAIDVSLDKVFLNSQKKLEIFKRMGTSLASQLTGLPISITDNLGPAFEKAIRMGQDASKKWFDNMKKQAASIREELMTPQQRFERMTENVSRLIKGGFLGAKEAAEYLKRQREELFPKKKEQKKASSSVGFARVFDPRFIDPAGLAKSGKKIEEKQLDMQTKIFQENVKQSALLGDMNFGLTTP